MSKHHHIGLLSKGKDFLESANKLNETLSYLAAPLSVYYLYFHAVELALKSYVYLHTENEKELRGIGHDLEAAWEEAKKHGISNIFSDTQELEECLQLINPTYKGKELEYFYSGLKRLPAINHVSNSSNNLVTSLDRYYRAELRKTRNKSSNPDAVGAGS